MFAALSENEEFYKDKINLFVALAPIARMKNIDNEQLKNFKGIQAGIIDFIKH